MHKQQESHPFIADVLALKLRFPIVTIAKRTNDDKGNVCSYVRGRKKPSKSFLLRFYTAFKQELSEVGIHRDLKLVGLETMEAAAPSPTPQEYSERILAKLKEQLSMSQKLLEVAIRTEQKTNELLKWYKFGGQRWEQN